MAAVNAMLDTVIGDTKWDKGWYERWNTCEIQNGVKRSQLLPDTDSVSFSFAAGEKVLRSWAGAFHITMIPPFQEMFKTLHVRAHTCAWPVLSCASLYVFVRFVRSQAKNSNADERLRKMQELVESKAKEREEAEKSKAKTLEPGAADKVVMGDPCTDKNALLSLQCSSPPEDVQDKYNRVSLAFRTELAECELNLKGAKRNAEKKQELHRTSRMEDWTHLDACEQALGPDGSLAKLFNVSPHASESQVTRGK